MNLLQVIKQAAMEAVEASEPSDFIFGTVKSTTPLIVTIDQKLELTSEFLILTSNVSDYKVKITSSTSEQMVTIHNGLKNGDKVILIKQKGGQKYLVLDKIGGKE